MICKLKRVKRSTADGRPRHGVQSPAQEAVVALMRTADVVRRKMARVVETQGITLQQYNVLRILRGGGRDGVPTLEVAARMIEETPGITRLLDRLEAKGWVRRERCPHDRRQHLCWISPEGMALLAKLDAPILAASDAALDGLTAAERLTLRRLLDAIRAEHDAVGGDASRD
jgi:DNA-binding MarR family transcriptional regulator